MTSPLIVNEAGEGPTLIFLHGWTMDGGLFAGQLQRLSDRFHCLAPDLPGHGHARDRAANLDNAAALVDEIIAARDLRDVTLIGWSMGAAAAWRYISLFGTGRLSRLMTVDMSPKIVNGPGWDLGLIGQYADSIATGTARFRADWTGSAPAIAAGMFATREGPAAFDARRAEAKIRDNDPHAMNSMWASLVGMDERATIPLVDIPYLVSYGTKSRVYPASCADWLTEAAPVAYKHGFANSGHSPHLEEPDAFAAAVAGFVLETGT
ncbi:MAG: alpha/beta hydrolase [Hyphomicrobiales bacterium]|nr:alpha/beta hydrolase [Hyphomicrobiales bacterium]